MPQHHLLDAPGFADAKRDFQPGVFRLEPSEQARQDIRARGLRRPDEEPAAPQPFDFVHGALRFIEQREDAPGVVVAYASRLCQPRGLAGRLEQLHSDLPLEFADLNADRRLTDLEFGGGAGEAAGPRDGVEDLQ
jgi:hypothetical protein